MATQDGVSRRDLMKKGAVAGAVVWTAPVLMSSPAFAATTACGGSKPCTTFYYVKFENSTCSSSSTGDGSGCGNQAALVGCNGATPQLANGCSLVSGGHSGTTATVTYPADAVPQLFQLKPGSSCYTYRATGTGTSVTYTLDGSVTGTPPGGCVATFTTTQNQNGTLTLSVTWPAGSTCKGISHIGFYFCR